MYLFFFPQIFQPSKTIYWQRAFIFIRAVQDNVQTFEKYSKYWEWRRPNPSSEPRKLTGTPKAYLKSINSICQKALTDHPPLQHRPRIPALTTTKKSLLGEEKHRLVNISYWKRVDCILYLAQEKKNSNSCETIIFTPQYSYMNLDFPTASFIHKKYIKDWKALG